MRSRHGRVHGYKLMSKEIRHFNSCSCNLQLSHSHMAIDTPLITVIIPVYQAKQYIVKCVESIQRCRTNNYEIILIDDGSTDGSGYLCNQISSHDTRIITLHQNNQGVSHARNRGIENARGKWVWFVDADDEVVPNALDILTDAIKETDSDTILSGLINIFQNGSNEINCPERIYDIDKEILLERVFAFQNGMILFSQEIIRQYNLKFSTDIKIGEDLEFQYKYLLLCKKTITLGRPLYIYFRRDGSTMLRHENIERNAYDSLKVTTNILDYVTKMKIIEKKWLSLRLRLLLKASIQSAVKLDRENQKKCHQLYRKCIKKAKKEGVRNISDRTLFLAYYFWGVYRMSFNCYMRWRAK